MGIKQQERFYTHTHVKNISLPSSSNDDDGKDFSYRYRQLSLFSSTSLLALAIMFLSSLNPLILLVWVAGFTLFEWFSPKLTKKIADKRLLHSCALGLFTGAAPVLALSLLDVQQLFIIPLIITVLSACACLLLAPDYRSIIGYMVSLASPFALFISQHLQTIPLAWIASWLVALSTIGFASKLRSPQARTDEPNKHSQLETDLKNALDNNELDVYYQPRYDLQKQQITKAEALIRWRHADFGYIPPIHIIALAERTGLIHKLGEFVIQTACRDASHWQKLGFDTGVSVNLSTTQLIHSERLIRQIKNSLNETDLCPGSLELELTESVLIEQFDDAMNTLQEIKKLGLETSIDDFGTGYSSLCYLKNLPVDSLKVDRSFIRDVTDSHKGRAVLESIISMAHKLDLKVVAEGVEKQSTVELLKQYNCDEVQGHLISPPIPEDQLIKILADYNKSLSN